MVVRPVTCAERAAQRRGRHGERVGVVGGVVVAGVVALEHGAVKRRCSCTSASSASRRSVREASYQRSIHSRTPTAGGAGAPGCARRAGRSSSAPSASISASSAGRSPGGTATVRPPRPGQQPGRACRGARPRSASISSPKRTTAPSSASPPSNTCTWPRPITVTVPGAHRHRRAVDRVLPAARRGPRSARGSRGGAARAAPRRRSAAPSSRTTSPRRRRAGRGRGRSPAPHSRAGAGGASGRRPRRRAPAARRPRAAAGANATSSTTRVPPPGERLERAVVVPGRARAEPRRSRKPRPGSTASRHQVVVVDRQHAAEQDPRAPERAHAGSRPRRRVMRASGASSALTPSIVAARAHTSSGGRRRRAGHAEGTHRRLVSRAVTGLSELTTLRLGGPAGAVVEARTEDELVAAVRGRAPSRCSARRRLQPRGRRRRLPRHRRAGAHARASRSASATGASS